MFLLNKKVIIEHLLRIWEFKNYLNLPRKINKLDSHPLLAALYLHTHTH